MSKSVRNLLIAFLAAVASGAAIGFFGAVTGSADRWTTLWLPAAAFLFTYTILNGLSDNRNVKLGDAEQRRLALQGPPPGQARLLLFREGFVGRAVGVDVLLDDVIVAQLKSPRFVALDVEPGTHALAARSASSSGKLAAEPLHLAVKAGEVAAYRLDMKMGALKNQLVFSPQPDLDAVRERLRKTPLVMPDAAAVF